MRTTVVPPKTSRPDVLPTARLLESGKAIPEIRLALRKIPNKRNALSVVVVWVEALALLASPRLGLWPVVVVAFILMGTMHARFAILMHEAAHKLLFSNKALNDFVGTWFIAYPAMVPISIYRRAHFAHHREEFGPDEPDIGFYRGYPCSPRDLRRRLVRDAVGISGWKNFATLLKATRTKSGRKIAVPILLVQVALFGICWAASGVWWSYPLLWWGSWMTQWRVLNRLRAIAEHGGMEANPDRRATTHNVTQHLIARVWFVPYNTGWHLAHHVDMGVPFRHLPAYHRELVDAGYITTDITYPSYTALWRALVSGPPASKVERV